MKRDVVQYCKTCHICQYAGKPNQGIQPTPLIPVPMIGEPFEHVIVDRSFAVGDQVLVLLPVPGSALTARF